MCVFCSALVGWFFVCFGFLFLFSFCLVLVCCFVFNSNPYFSKMYGGSSSAVCEEARFLVACMWCPRKLVHPQFWQGGTCLGPGVFWLRPFVTTVLAHLDVI